ncbi:hypothetical protein OG21DRAFT_1508705 [Imleria badia]|nr:hypothetical protein OG21DRAFT_1508705 [Imleria badia]
MKPGSNQPNQPTLHVAVVGNTGVGKSTLVNVLKGKEIAKVDNNVIPCTARTTPYEMEVGRTKYCIWDTRGLNEGSEKAAFFVRWLRRTGILPDADRELKRFLRGRNPSIDLVLLLISVKRD